MLTLVGGGRMVKDDRIKGERQRGIIGLGDAGDLADRLG